MRNARDPPTRLNYTRERDGPSYQNLRTSYDRLNNHRQQYRRGPAPEPLFSHTLKVTISVPTKYFDEYDIDLVSVHRRSIPAKGNKPDLYSISIKYQQWPKQPNALPPQRLEETLEIWKDPGVDGARWVRVVFRSEPVVLKPRLTERTSDLARRRSEPVELSFDWAGERNARPRWKEKQWYLGTHAEFVGNGTEHVQPDWDEKEGFACRRKNHDDGAKVFWVDDGEGGEMLRIKSRGNTGRVEVFGKPWAVAKETERSQGSASEASETVGYDDQRCNSESKDGIAGETRAIVHEGHAGNVGISRGVGRFSRNSQKWWLRARDSVSGLWFMRR